LSTVARHSLRLSQATSFCRRPLSSSHHRPRTRDRPPPPDLTLAEMDNNLVKSELLRHLSARDIPFSPLMREKLDTLLSLYPCSQQHVMDAILRQPRLLHHDPDKFFNFTQVLVECGDYNISQEEAMHLLSSWPDVLQVEEEEFRRKMSALFSHTAQYNIPWTIVIKESPQTLLLHPKDIQRDLARLEHEFGPDQVGSVIANNPDIIGLDWRSVKKIIDFAIGTMGVSPYRITRSPNFLIADLDFIKLRYEFVLRCGKYRHPDPRAKSSRPMEASPLPHLITEPDVTRFVLKATPGVSVEEFYVFAALFEQEKLQSRYDDDGYFDDYEEELLEEEQQYRDSFRGKQKKTTGGGKVKGREKAPKAK